MKTGAGGEGRGVNGGWRELWREREREMNVKGECRRDREMGWIRGKCMAWRGCRGA